MAINGNPKILHHLDSTKNITDNETSRPNARSVRPTAYLSVIDQSVRDRYLSGPEVSNAPEQLFTPVDVSTDKPQITW